jgi:hypothetical protein
MFRSFCAHRRGKVTRSGAGPVGLKMPDFARYDAMLGSGWTMLRRCVLVFSLVALGLVLDGCTRCGPIWDDWLHAPKSCRSDRL